MQLADSWTLTLAAIVTLSVQFYWWMQRVSCYLISVEAITLAKDIRKAWFSISRHWAICKCDPSYSFSTLDLHFPRPNGPGRTTGVMLNPSFQPTDDHGLHRCVRHFPRIPHKTETQQSSLTEIFKHHLAHFQGIVAHLLLNLKLGFQFSSCPLSMQGPCYFEVLQ